MILPANDGLKPGIWNVQQGLVAPEWQELWAEPLFSLPLWEGTGNPFELVSRALSTSNNAAWSQNSLGWLLDAEGSSSDHVPFANNFSSISPPYLLLAVLSFTTTSNTVIFESNGNAFSFQTTATTGTVLLNAGNALRGHFSSTDIGDGLPHTIACMMRGDLATDKIFVDGVDDTGTIELQAKESTFDGTWDVFSRSGSAGYPDQVSLLHLCRGNFGDDFLAKLTVDPFGPFRIAEQPVAAFVPAAAGATVAHYAYPMRVY